MYTYNQKINISSLIKTISIQIKFFKNTQIKKHYFEAWQKHLEGTLLQSSTEPRNAKDEIFTQETILFNRHKIYFHYKITEIHTLVSQIPIFTTEKLPVSNFIDPSYCRWTYQQLPSIQLKTNPILINELVFITPKYTVIDGNHRLSHAMRTKQSTIDTIIITPELAIRYNMFINDFEKSLYAFLTEINKFYDLKHNYHRSDKDLFNQSYLFKLL